MNIFNNKKVYFLALTISLFIMAKAQSDFRPGYIITLHGDTIKGLINFGSDKASAKSCTFKKGLNLEKVTYTPDQIKSYQFINGKYYLSSISMNFKLKDQVFLEYVIKGSVSVFYYQDDIKDHYFVAKDTAIIELDHHDRPTGIAEEDNLILLKAEKFKAQLKLLVEDQPALFEKIDMINCNTKDLILMTKEYQKLSCPSQECTQYEKRTDGSLKFKFGLLSSVGFSHLSSPPYSMYVNDYSETKFLNFKPTLTYEIGVLLNTYLDYTGKNKFCIQLSPSLNFVEYTSNEEKSLGQLLYVYKLNIKYTTLKIPLLLKYSFYSSNRRMIPFVKLGPGCAIYLSQQGNYEYYSVPIASYSGQLTKYIKPLNKLSKSNKIYFIAGTGTDIKCGKRLLSIGATCAYGDGQLEGSRTDLQVQLELQF